MEEHDMSSPTTETRHYLVVASAARGARFFIKNALRQGHNITALCRAVDDQAALQRMQQLLEDTALTVGGVEAAATSGTLHAMNSDILQAETFRKILSEDSSVDAVCCFVGPSKMSEFIFSRRYTLFTQTIGAIVEGMHSSRWVEFFYHGSSGSEGAPGEHRAELPANFSVKWLQGLAFRLPGFQDYIASESILANVKVDGLKFIVFRPAYLRSDGARRRIGRSHNTTGMDKEELPLHNTKTSISREDVAEEMLRVSLLPQHERATNWYGHGVYLVDLKDA